MGGDSLSATRVVANARSTGLRLSVADLFANPTIAQLAGTAGSGRGGEDAVLDITPAPEQRFEPFPLTEIQQAYLLGRQTRLHAWPRCVGEPIHHAHLLDRDGAQSSPPSSPQTDRLFVHWHQTSDIHVAVPDRR